MPMIVSVRSSDPAPSARVLPWPVLEAGNGSFVNGVYSVTITHMAPGRSFFLHHDIEGAGLITNWLENHQAKFACVVADPVSAYRRFHFANEPRHAVEWDPNDLGSRPIFTPMIVSTSDIFHRVDAERDELHQLWHGRVLQLTRGSRIAICSTFAFQSGLLGLLDFHLREDLDLGRFTVEPSLEEGFKFKVYLARDLFEHLRHCRLEIAGRNIMTHVVSAALAHLQHEYATDDGEEGWKSYSNLVSFAEWLRERKCGHWSDDDFDPAFAATSLYPHRVPSEYGREDD